MSWQCSLCESINSDELIMCEVCDSKSPFLVKFNYKYDGSEKAIIEWRAENAQTIVAMYNSHEYDVSTWKAARVSLKETITIVSIIVSNEITERTYTFGIPKS